MNALAKCLQPRKTPRDSFFCQMDLAASLCPNIGNQKLIVVLDVGPWRIYENLTVSWFLICFISTTNVLFYSVMLVLFLYMFFFTLKLFPPPSCLCWAGFVVQHQGTARTLCMNLLHHYACQGFSVGPNCCQNEGCNCPVKSLHKLIAHFFCLVLT